jgi:nucleoside-diphosphate-sugar epimerase
MHLEGDNRRLRDAAGWSVRVSLGEGLRQVVDELRIAA